MGREGGRVAWMQGGIEADNAIVLKPTSFEELVEMVEVLSNLPLSRDTPLLIGPTHEICTACEHGLISHPPSKRQWMAFVRAIRAIGVSIQFYDESREPLNWLSRKVRESFHLKTRAPF